MPTSSHPSILDPDEIYTDSLTSDKRLKQSQDDMSHDTELTQMTADLCAKEQVTRVEIYSGFRGTVSMI